MKHVTLKRNSYTTGFGIVEVLVAAVIITLVLVGIHSATTQALWMVQQSTKRTQATFLLQETIAALKSQRDAGWGASLGSLTASTNYYLEWSGGMWTTTTTNIFIDKTFERKFTITDVNRDATNDDIAPAGTPDAGTKLITATVAWHSQTGTTTQTIQTYITDMFQN
jgi:Tfp pilus assembly protein PilV